MIASFLNYMFGYNKQPDICNNTNTNTINKLCKKLPYELKNIIFEYDGRIKYKYKLKNAIDYHKFVNVIHKYDERYNIIIPIINKKQKIIKDTETRPNDTSFYFEFSFSRLFVKDNSRSWRPFQVFVTVQSFSFRNISQVSSLLTSPNTKLWLLLTMNREP